MTIPVTLYSQTIPDSKKKGTSHSVLNIHKKTYIIIAVSQIQRRFVLHVPQHRVSTRLAEDVGDGGVLSPYGKMQGRAAIKHGSVNIGPPAEEKLHRCDVVQLDGEMEGCFSARSFLQGCKWKKNGHKIQEQDKQDNAVLCGDLI